MTIKFITEDIVPFLARLMNFYTQINDQTWDDNKKIMINTFVNYMMTNVNQIFMGIEFGFESNITSTMQLTGAYYKLEIIFPILGLFLPLQETILRN